MKKAINHFPVINDIKIDTPELYPGNSTTIIVAAYDPDPEDDLTYFYETMAGKIIGTGSEVDWIAPEIPGVYTIRVVVTDPDGLSTDKEIYFIVNEFNYLPRIITASATPDSAQDDKAVQVFFTIEIYDQNGLHDIYGVSLDLSEVDGDNDQKMYDNGKHGDIQREDGIYSYEYLVPDGLPTGMKQITITVRDRSMIETSYELKLTIERGSEKKSSGGFLNIPGFELNIMLVGLICIIIILSNSNRKR